jgi:hypothetical protein
MKHPAKRTERHRPDENAARVGVDKGPVIRVPLKATLRKYGLDAEAWLAILERQGWVCAICKKVAKNGQFRTDHAHVPGWKKMKPEKRRTYVRGLTCWWCNKSYLGRGITEEKAANMAAYLRAFALRMELAR